MATAKITEKALQGLRSAAAQSRKPAFLWDTETKGFGVKAFPGGSLSYVFQVWEGGRGGKARRITLTEVTLEKARVEAQAKRVEANKGTLVSPRDERLARQREELQRKTISEAVSLYLSESRQPGRYWLELEQQLTNQVLPYLRDTLKLNPELRRITEVTTEDLRHLLKSFNDRPATKRRVYSNLSPFFKWLLSEGYLASNPLASVPIPKGLKSRDRTLTKEEIKAFWLATDLGSHSPQRLGYPWAPFYRLLLLTAQRREEVAAMEWSELDLTLGVWTIPSSKTKNGKEHIVHLSPQALGVIRTVPKQQSKYVFTTNLSASISGYSKAKRALDKLMPEDKPPWRIHDLRRTAKTGLASLGVPKEVSEKVLNHVSNSASDLEAIYNRYEYLPERKAALVQWGHYLEGIIISRS
jgi:integrase